MMRKKLAVTALIAALFLLICPSAWAAFSDDPDAVEEALGSVLMLEVYGDEGMIATGSGFVAFNNRTLITNFHVVEEATYLIAYSDAGDPYILMDAKLLDAHRDIAILSFFSPTDLKPLTLNTDGALKRAQRVVAVGSPLGITNTVAMGNISGVYSDDGVSMIQFTAPISEGSSGGALFDDNGNVIGVTTATMESGQNLNLAVHIKEVADLYSTWDGTTFSISGAASSGSAAAAALPTDVPEPIAPAAPSTGALAITSVTMQKDGTVRVTWTGGTAPYELYYQIAGDRSQKEVNREYFHWYEEDSYTGNSAVLDYMVPDQLYRLDIEDARGSTADTFFLQPSSPFSPFDADVTFTLRQRRGGVSSTVSAYSAAAIQKSLGSEDAFGMTIKVGLGEGLKQDLKTRMCVAALLPNGDVDVIEVGDTTIYSGSGEDYTYWEFFDFETLWDDLMDKHESIPKGTYTLYLYFDSELAGTKKFMII